MPGWVSQGLLGCSRAHTCWCLCSPVPTYCLSPPDYITELLDPASAPQQQLQVGFSLSEPHGRSRRNWGRTQGCAWMFLFPAATPQHLLCPHPSCAAPTATHRMAATIAPQEIPSIYGPNSHCLAWINQKENKALRKKVLNFPCAPEGMGQALAVYFLGSLFASTVSDIVFTKVFMSSEQSHSSASSPVYFM